MTKIATKNQKMKKTKNKKMKKKNSPVRKAQIRRPSETNTHFIKNNNQLNQNQKSTSQAPKT